MVSRWDTRRSDARSPDPAAREQAEADRQTASLAALAVTLALVVMSLFLIQKLSSEAALEDCLLSGHRDCAAIMAVRGGASLF